MARRAVISPVRDLVERDIAWDVVCHDGAVLGRVPSAPAAVARDPFYERFLRIGARTEIGANAVIYVGVMIGSDCLIGDLSSIREGTVIGDTCLIGRCVTINYGARIGSRVRIMDGTHITGEMEIGDDTFIGVNVTTSNDRGIDPSDYHFDKSRLQPPKIGSGVFIGSGANILPGVTIGDGAVIGAHVLVLKNVPPGAKLLATPKQTVLGPDEYR